MGFIKPEMGQTYRLVLELKGSRGLTQKNYQAYRAAIEKVVKNFGAKVVAREKIITTKNPKGRGPK